MKDKFNELIIGSGGLSGLSYLGSLKVLNQYYPLHILLVVRLEPVYVH